MSGSWAEEFASYSHFGAGPSPSPFVEQSPGDGNCDFYFGDVESAVESSPESSTPFLSLPQGSCGNTPRQTGVPATGWNPAVGLDFPVNFVPQAGFDPRAPFKPPSIPSSSDNGSLQGATSEVGFPSYATVATDVLLQPVSGGGEGIHVNHMERCDSSHTEPGDSSGDVNGTLQSTPPPALVHITPHARVPRSRHHRPAQSTPIITKTPGRRGPFRDPKEREQTALARKLGACLRCRVQKTRVRSKSFALNWFVPLGRYVPDPA